MTFAWSRGFGVTLIILGIWLTLTGSLPLYCLFNLIGLRGSYFQSFRCDTPLQRFLIASGGDLIIAGIFAYRQASKRPPSN